MTDKTLSSALHSEVLVGVLMPITKIVQYLLENSSSTFCENCPEMLYQFTFLFVYLWELQTRLKRVRGQDLEKEIIL